MKLIVKKKTVFKVDYSDFENFVNEYFELDGNYSFVADWQGNNDSSYSYHVNKDLQPWDIKSIEILKTTKNYSFIAATLLRYFASKDLIKEGEYIIKVSW